MIIKAREKKTKRQIDSDCNLNMEKKRRAKENFAITPFLFKVCSLSISPIFFFLFFALPICAHIHIYLIYVYTFAWFLFSPIIAREGHKISCTYTLYLYDDAPLWGHDKMSNRSSGTFYAYIDDQYNTVQKGKREKKKKRETNCEKTDVNVYLDLSNERNVLIG